MVAAILVLPHLNAHLLNAREESHSDWIDVNPNPSLSTATSWKEAYISETFWKKQLLPLLLPWELDHYLFSNFWITSWEMMYEAHRKKTRKTRHCFGERARERDYLSLHP